MSNGKHTKGPWTLKPSSDPETPGDWEINSCGRPWSAIAVAGAGSLGARTVTPEEAEANARLIAASPELLEVCYQALAYLQAGVTDHNKAAYNQALAYLQAGVTDSEAAYNELVSSICCVIRKAIAEHAVERK